MLAAETLPNLPELTIDQAEAWIAAALAEARALRQHDEQLDPASPDPAAMQAAHQLYTAWKKWADEAEALYDRLGPRLKDGRHIAGAHDLNYAIGRARAMLKLTPEMMQARREQVARGEVLTAEEVRRELRLAHRG
jgi:hypothetical protein